MTLSSSFVKFLKLANGAQFSKMAPGNIVLMVTFIIFLGVCTEFNVAGGIIQGQGKTKCNERFPKCIQLYNSTDAYKCKKKRTLNVFELFNF